MTYAYLAKGRNQQEMRELDLALSPSPELREKTIDQQNMEAMRALGDVGKVRPVPLPSKRRKSQSG